jgi:hypothetical protein
MKSKDFDCVEMKQEIQNRILAETQGMSWEDYCRQTEAVIRANPVLAPILEGARPARAPMTKTSKPE